MSPENKNERLIESLADREENLMQSEEPADSTLLQLKSDLDELQQQLRMPQAVDQFTEESACDRVVQAIEAIGREPSRKTRLDLQERLPVASTSHEASGSDLGVLAQYQLLEKLGEGGMGAVYKALHLKLEKIVALKVMTASRNLDQAAISRFEREKRAAGKLSHINIVTALDAGEVDGTHYLVMELLHGIDLGALVKQRGRLPIGASCELIRQAALGLQHGHDHNLVHRDVKPSNLMLTFPRNQDESPIVKVLDLGLALLDEAHREMAGELTSTGQVMGTLEYMAPEQASDTHSVDGRADIYSLGASLYKLLTGNAPFPGNLYRSQIKLLMALATEEPPPIAVLCPEIPAELSAVIHRSLAKKPEARFSTAREFAKALAQFSQPADVLTLVEFLATTPCEVSIDVNSPTFVSAQGTTKFDAVEQPALSSGNHPEKSKPAVTIAPVVQERPRRTGTDRRRPLGLITACSVLGMLIFAATYFFNVRTPHGELIIQSEFPGISVKIKREGKELVNDWRLSTGSDNQKRIETGPIEIDLPPDLDGDFKVTPKKLTLIQNGVEVVKIERKADAPQGPDIAKRPPTATAASMAAASPSGSAVKVARVDPVIPPAERDRVAAERWIGRGGTGLIVSTTSGVVEIKPGTKLPDGKFHFIGTRIPPPNLRGDDLQRLEGLQQLRDIGLAGAVLDTTGIEAIRQIPRLQNLFIDESATPTSALSGFSNLVFLRNIHLNGRQVDDEWRFLQNLPNLREVTLSNYQHVVGGFQKSSKFRQLREIYLSGEQTVDAKLVEDFQRNNPACRIVTGIPKRSIGRDPVLDAAEKLLAAGLTITAHDSLGADFTLTKPLLEDKTRPMFWGRMVTIPPATNLAADDLGHLSQFPMIWMTATGRQKADELVKNLPDDLIVEEINFFYSDLTDEGLGSLQRFAPLWLLNLHGTKVTLKGVEAYHKVRPESRILTDFGEFGTFINRDEQSSPKQEPLSGVDRGRVAAELWRKKGGGGVVATKLTGRFESFGPDHALPAEPFELFYAEGQIPRSMTDAELEQFADLTYLRRFAPYGENLENHSIRHLKRMPSLTTLGLERTRITTSALSELKSLIWLDELWISGNLVDDNWKFVEQLPNLRTLWICNFQPSALDWKRFEQLRQLREIHFVYADPAASDTAAVIELQKRNPLCRILFSKDKISALGQDPVREAVRKLVQHQIVAEMEAVIGVGPLKSTVAEVLEDATPFTVRNVILPVEMSHDKAVLNDLRNLPFLNLRALAHRNSDALFAAMPSEPLCKELDLQHSDLSDTGLSVLNRMKQLRYVNLFGTNVTQEGLDAFRNSVPACTIVSNFGTFLPVFPIPNGN